MFSRRNLGLCFTVLALIVTSLPLFPLRAESAKKLKVVTSIYPVYDLTQKIAGDLCDVSMMSGSGVDAHTYEPSAKEIAQLEEADVFVYNGAGMEHWAEDVIAGLSHKDLKVIVASDGADLLSTHRARRKSKGESVQTGVSLEAKDWKPLVLTDEERVKKHKGHYDPHSWLAPINALGECYEIKEGLKAIDPSNADAYETNFKKVQEAFIQLDQEFRETLSQTSQKKIVVAHEAFGYLCTAYGLEQTGIEGLEPHSEPSSSRIAEIIEQIKAEGIKTVFFETAESSKVSDTIAAESGAEVAVLSPLEFLTEEQEAAGADYFSVMRENLAALARALK